MKFSSTNLLKAARLKDVAKLTEAVSKLQKLLSTKPGAIGGQSEVGSHKPFPHVPTHGGTDHVLKPGGGGVWSMPATWSKSVPTAEPAPVAPGALFLSRTYTNQSGSRPYKVYVPSRYSGKPVPLIVMLHGCTQSADDFAAGTRMNTAAEAHGCLVVYPEQVTAANMQKCWKWFSPQDQQRDKGEPSLIAGITREVMRDYAVDPNRVFIAGLSAGGAAAAIMGDTYPELYAAIGVHSGLARGAAIDTPSALAAMKGQGAGSARQTNRSNETNRRMVPAIVFHGDNDTTVVPSNADAVLAQARHAADLTERTEMGKVPGGLSYSRTLYMNRAGLIGMERWLVHAAGHAWSGGSADGSYTDPRGPDATDEMLRFFLEHPLSA